MIAHLTELDDFFMERGKLFHTLKKISQRFSEHEIDYVIVGGMALFFHGYTRATQDIDVLLTPEGLKFFQDNFIGRGFVSAFPGAKRTFRDAETGIEIDILVQGDYPGDGKPKPVRFPDPATTGIERDGIRLIELNRLIELKLASGLSGRDRLKDLADVQELIRVLALPRAFAVQLDPSVRYGFIDLWQSIQQSKQHPPEWER